jgi:hypothetical protein
MAGIRLEELETRDMLDVLHYLFEEDLSVYSAEQLESKNKIRQSLYPILLGQTYKYASKKDYNSDYGLENLDDPLEKPNSNQKQGFNYKRSAIKKQRSDLFPNRFRSRLHNLLSIPN